MKSLLKWTKSITHRVHRSLRHGSPAMRLRMLRIDVLERRELLAATLTINGGLDLTNFRDVTASFENVAPTPEQVRFAFNGTNYGAWQDFEPTKEVTIPNWVGRNYVNAEIRFADGSTQWAWDAIDYALPGMRINNDATVTNLRDVTLSFERVAPDAQSVRFAFNGYNWSAPVDFTDSTVVTLPNWVGTNYVNAQILYAGDETRTVWDKIDYRIPTVAINDGQDLTHSRDVALSFQNVAETATHVQFAFNGFNYGSAVDFEPTIAVTLPNWDGINYVNARIHYADGSDRWVYDSIDFTPAVVVQSCDECIAFRLHVVDSPNEGFRDSQLGDDRVAAFTYAMGIWSDLLQANYAGETIAVEAQMDPLDPFVLGEAGPNGVVGINSVVHGDALGNHKAGYDVRPATPEVTATFNSDYNWYYGTEANPGQQRDFATVVLHEIGHGLNFSHGLLEDGSWNYSIGGTPVPGIFDTFLVDAAGVRLTSMTQAQRATAMTSNALYWGGPMGADGNQGQPPRLYAPSHYDPGSSVSHLDEAHHGEELMSPGYSGPDHTASPIELGMLQDMGWTMMSAASSGSTVSGTATSSGRSITASQAELSNNVAPQAAFAASTDAARPWAGSARPVSTVGQMPTATQLPRWSDPRATVVAPPVERTLVPTPHVANEWQIAGSGRWIDVLLNEEHPSDLWMPMEEHLLDQLAHDRASI